MYNALGVSKPVGILFTLHMKSIKEAAFQVDITIYDASFILRNWTEVYDYTFTV